MEIEVLVVRTLKGFNKNRMTIVMNESRKDDMLVERKLIVRS
jgi:hypothetical protein